MKKQERKERPADPAIIQDISDAELIEQAAAARLMAHAPFSKFLVGAALLSADGRVFTGCNIENSVYNLTMCAERVAIFKAVSEGVERISKIAVVADHQRITPPCGCCRQMVWEFGAPGTTVLLANLAGELLKFNIEDLLPVPFDAGFLDDNR